MLTAESVLLLASLMAGSAQPAAHPLLRHDVVVDGYRLAVWEKRRPTGAASEKILLVHGRTWSSLPNFDLHVPGEDRSFMDALAGAGLDVFAVDLRGYGASPRDASGYITPDRAVADVTAVIAWMHQQGPRTDPVFLFGLSRGAMIAAMVAQQHPEALSGVVLLGFGFDPDARVQPEHTSAPAPRVPNTADAAGSDFITRDAYTVATVNSFVKAALHDDPIYAEWRDEHQFNAFVPSKMRVPALLVHGSHDPQSPVDIETKLFTRFGTPDKWWVVLPGADHAAHLEKASGELVRVMVSFIHRYAAPHS